jgi:hypothetical protein
MVGSDVVPAGPHQRTTVNADTLIKEFAADMTAFWRYKAEDALTALSYPRGSEAQIRCLEEIGQDVRSMQEGGLRNRFNDKFGNLSLQARQGVVETLKAMQVLHGDFMA